jgi:hypothetical protein
MYEAHMNFVFRLESPFWDVSLCSCKYSQIQRNLKSETSGPKNFREGDSASRLHSLNSLPQVCCFDYFFVEIFKVSYRHLGVSFLNTIVSPYHVLHFYFLCFQLLWKGGEYSTMRYWGREGRKEGGTERERERERERIHKTFITVCFL